MQKLTLDQIKEFLSQKYASEVKNLSATSGREWSDAYFYDVSGKSYVIRFSDQNESFLKDKYVSQFRSEKLPIPEVYEIGEVFGKFFCISERLFGDFIEELDRYSFGLVIQNLFDTILELKKIDLSDTKGFGGWDENGNGTCETWGERILSINEDNDHNWRSKLEDSEFGTETFDKAYQVLEGHIVYLPESRNLIHADMMHKNVLVQNNKISGIFDWQCSVIGDFVFDIAWFAFWAEWHDGLKDYNFYDLARIFFDKNDIHVIDLEKRLFAYEIFIGLDSVVYTSGLERWKDLGDVYEKLKRICKFN